MGCMKARNIFQVALALSGCLARGFHLAFWHGRALTALDLAGAGLFIQPNSTEHCCQLFCVLLRVLYHDTSPGCVIPVHACARNNPDTEASRTYSERDREFHQSIQPALACEDASWLEPSAKLRMAVRQWQTAFWSLCHTKHCMVPSASWYNERNWRRTWAK